MFNEYNKRDSRFELLRLFSIFGIIFHHLIIKGADTVGYITPFNYEIHGGVGIFLNSIFICGVNLFILITGWFGCKHQVKGIFRILIDCIVFGSISYLFLTIFSNHQFKFNELYRSCYFVTNWYAVAYIMLLLIAPLLEKSLDKITSHELGRWLLLLTIFNVYFGYHLKKVNDNGYNVVNFIYLYYIGRYLRISCNNWVIFIRKHSLLIYFINIVFLTFGFIILNKIGRTPTSIHWFAYNQPFVLCCSISLFLFFSNLNIQSDIINILAKGVFGTFLLHTTPYVIPFRNETASFIFEDYSYRGLFILTILIWGIGIILSIFVNIFNQRLLIWCESLYSNCKAKIIKLFNVL